MRRRALLILLVGFFHGAQAAAASHQYWLLSKEQGRTWCAYADMRQFQTDFDNAMPSEVATVTYSANKLATVTYQVQPQSADWLLIDTYSVSGDRVHLQRLMRLAQENLQVIQATDIRGGKAEPFRVVKVTTLYGDKAELPAAVNLPQLPIQTELSRMPFMPIIAQIRESSAARLCRPVR
jgi:hypothetical protein